MNKDSLSKRYAFKLGSSLLGIPLGLITSAIIPRALGPEGYGSFTFLQSSFQQFFSLFDSGTSTAFFTKISQRPDDEGLKVFYWRFFVMVICIVSILTIGTILSGYSGYILPKQKAEYIIYGLMFGALYWGNQITNKMIDAYSLTVKGEIVFILQRVVGVSFIVLLFLYEYLELRTYFYHQIVMMSVLFYGYAFVLRKHDVPVYPKMKLMMPELKKYISEMYKYASPLLFTSIYGFLLLFFDRWVLQAMYGSAEQGYFGLAFQINAFCILFTASMVPLLTRELSVAFGNNDTEGAKRIFTKITPVVYSVTAYFTIFLAMQAKNITHFFGGEAYNNAQYAVTLMILYTLTQSYGQLSGSYYYARAKTKTYRNIQITMQTIGLIYTFVLLAPEKYYGFNLGATGLSMKFFIHGFVTVNVLLFFITRQLGLSFVSLFFHQIYIALMFGVIAYLSNMLIEMYFTNIIVSFLINGVLYSVICLIVFLFFPKLIGLEKEDIRFYFQKVRQLLNKRNQ